MKVIYQLLIVGMVCLLSTNTHAQVLQYSDDGKSSFIDPEAKNSNTERSCYCLAGVQLGIFNSEIQNLGGSEREKWLKEQEILLAVQISGVDYWGMYNSALGLPSDYDFGKIQTDYFKNKETNRVANEYFPKVDEYLANAYNHDKVALQSATVNSSILDIRKREGTVNPKYGDLKHKGEYLRDIANADVTTRLNEQLAIRDAQRSTFSRYDESRSRLERSINEGWVSNYLADQYVRHYNGLGYEDAIRFMTRYVASINSNDRPLAALPFGNPDNIFMLEGEDYTARIAVVTDLNPTMENWTPREFSNVIDDDRVLYGLALNNLKPAVRDFISRTDAIDVSDVFKENRYPEGMLDRYDDTFVRYLNNTPFDGSFSGGIVPNAGTATNLPTDLGAELAYRFSFNDAGALDGLRGFSNVLHDLFNLDENHNALKGSYIRSFFDADSQQNLGFLSDEQLGTLFDFGTVYPWQGVNYDNFFLEYRDNDVNRELLANDIRFLQLLANPFIRTAILALLDGGDVDFDDHIIEDPSVSPCLKNIIEQLKLKDTHASVNPDIPNGGNNHIAQIILDVFDKDPDYTLYFTEAVPRDPETNKPIPSANGQHVYVPETKTMFIRINPSLIKNGTNLAIAKTVIHESIHAYINRNLKPEFRNMDFALTLNALYLKLREENPNDDNISALTSHEFMAQFHDALAQSLAAWDFHQKPRGYYDQMAWGGLESSSFYKELTQEQKDEIQKILTNENTGHSNALGEKCP